VDSAVVMHVVLGTERRRRWLYNVPEFEITHFHVGKWRNERVASSGCTTEGVVIREELWAALLFYRVKLRNREKYHTGTLTEEIVRCFMLSCEC